MERKLKKNPLKVDISIKKKSNNANVILMSEIKKPP